MSEPKEPIRNRIKKYIANHEVNERVKTHFEKHKIKYYVGATVVATTAVEITVFTLLRKKQERATISVTSANNGGFHNSITNIDTVNIFVKRISKYGNDLGRRGNAVIDLTTNRDYKTETLAAMDMGVSLSTMSRHLHDKTRTVMGHEFMYLNDYLAARGWDELY